MEPERQEREALLQGHTRKVTSIAITSNDKYIASSSWDKTVRIWNFEDRRQEAVLQGHSSSVTSIVISNYGKYIVSAL